MTREETLERKGERACYCPYCNGDLTVLLPFCQGCGAELRFCAQCDQPLPKNAKVCPNCGAEVD
jgi:predicted amidophosphoribosyltransferase